MIKFIKNLFRKYGIGKCLYIPDDLVSSSFYVSENSIIENVEQDGDGNTLSVENSNLRNIKQGSNGKNTIIVEDSIIEGVSQG